MDNGLKINEVKGMEKLLGEKKVEGLSKANVKDTKKNAGNKVIKP
jgi:hypothetical protein